MREFKQRYWYWYWSYIFRSLKAPVLASFPLLTSQAGLLYNPTPEWTLNSSYVEPCEQYVPPPVILYAGSAAAAIVGVRTNTGVLEGCDSLATLHLNIMQLG